MPRNFLPIPNSYESITRPVVLEIAEQIKRFTELPPDVKVLLPGGMDQVAQVGSTVRPEGNPPTDDPSAFSHDNQILIEVTERFLEENVLSTTVHYRDQQAFFLDTKIGVQLTPVYSQTSLDFTISVRAKDRDTARRFRDHILGRAAQYRKENLHEFHYAYTVPPIHLHLLKQIHTMREAVAGYGEDFSTWVSNHITDRATNVATMSGNDQTLVIQEHQIEVLGWFDFPAAPEDIRKDNDAGTYNWDLNYRVNYDKVLGVAARWPLMVHNQIIPEPWHDSPVANGRQIDPDRRPRRSGRITAALQARIPHLYTDWCGRQIDGIALPEYDEWEPATVALDTSTVFTAMLSVDLAAPRLALALDELGDDIVIDPDILAFMRTETQYMHLLGKSIFHVSLYEDDAPLDYRLYGVDGDLNVASVNPMDPRQRYHARLALYNDLLAMSPSALDRFRSAGKACQKILMTLQWKLLKIATLPPLVGGRYVPREYLYEIGKRLNEAKGAHYTGQECRMLTVGQFIINLDRRTSNAHRQTDAEAGTPAPGSGDDHRYPVPGCDGGYPI